MSIVRVAMTETSNAYPDMPSSVEALPSLASKLEDIRKANVDHHVALMRVARAEGVKVIGFGELFPGPYFALGALEMWKGLAEDAEEGPTVTAIRAAAAAEKLIVVAPIYELSRDGRRFNTAVVIDEKGAILGKFRKTHIPHGSNEQGSFVENFYYERSDGKNSPPPKTDPNVSSNPYFPVFGTSIGNIGVAICYDRHFEGVMHTLAKEGADLVFSPAVTFGQKSERMWPMEFQVDAARHKIFIGGSNRRGAEAPWGQPFFGQSFFCGPGGVAKNISPDRRLVISDLQFSELGLPDPSGWDLPRDIRYDIYSKR